MEWERIMSNNNNILLIDDEPDVLKTVERMLLLEDYNVSTSTNGKQAIEMLHKTAFDLVITDIRMPGMDGIEVIEKVKAYDPSIEIIVLSGYATLENAIEALKEGGAFHFVLKPLNDLDSFYHVISQALEKRQLKIKNTQLMQQLEDANHNLEDQVRQKTASLEERVRELEILKQDLTIALEKADLARQAKSEFLGIMSHEMKTPINIILGNIELLMLKEREGDSKKYCEVVKKTCLSFSDIIDDLLLFSEVDNNDRMDEHFNISEVIGGISQILKQRAKEKNLSFFIEIDPNIPFNLQGKWRLMRQIIFNLCGNAIKFTNQGECRLKIFLEANADYDKIKQEGPVTLLFKVSDTGIGISEKIKDNIFIFDFFTQGDQSMTRKYGGVGMGLAICKKLSDKLGGKLWFESKENEGSQFYFQMEIMASRKELIFR